MGKPSDYGPILNGVMWLQVIISSVFIVLRIYTRYYIIRSLGWDDYMMVVNLVSEAPLDLCHPDTFETSISALSNRC
jgi:hypothetical protein